MGDVNQWVSGGDSVAARFVGLADNLRKIRAASNLPCEFLRGA
jgi:hypothetical protein